MTDPPDGFQVQMSAYAHPQRIAGGVWMPTPIRYTDGPLTVDLAVHDERVVVTRVTVERDAKEGGVRTEELRDIALSPIREWAVAFCSLARTDDTTLSPAVETIPDAEVRYVMERAAAKRHRGPVSIDVLRGAVHAWHHGGIPAVIEDCQVSDRTAFRWIARARQLGLIEEEK
jgi:hypothetical protein